MEKFQIGDFVTVSNPNQQCGKKLSKAWVSNFAPEYLDFLSTDDISEERQNAYQIKKFAFNSYSENECLVQNVFSRRCYLMFTSGLKYKYNKISKDDTVRIFNLDLVYSRPDFWIEKNAASFLKQCHPESTMPNGLNNYKVVAVAPKADFAPLNKENLALILNPITLNAFLVEEKGLWLCEEE